MCNLQAELCGNLGSRPTWLYSWYSFPVQGHKGQQYGECSISKCNSIPPAVLDYANLLECALTHDSEYVLILEDDLKPAKHALDKIYHTLKEQLSSHPDWGILTLFGNRYRLRPLTKVTRSGSSGGCAMVLKKTIIAGFIDYVRSDPYLAPVDLLLATFIERNKLQVYERSPNLFQHVSPHSSYYGKVWYQLHNLLWDGKFSETWDFQLHVSTQESLIWNYFTTTLLCTRVIFYEYSSLISSNLISGCYSLGPSGF